MKKNLVLILFISILVVGCKTSYSQKEYFCEEGTLETDKCKMHATADMIYKCSDGETLEDGKCKYISLKIPASKGDNVCAKGYYLYEKMCISEETKSRTIKDTICPSSTKDVTYEKGYGICFKYTCTEKDKTGKCTKKKEEIVDGEIKYSCPSGYKYVYYGCRKAYYINVKSVCPQGDLVDKYCVFYEYNDPKVSCPDGYIMNKEDNICEKDYYVDASIR